METELITPEKNTFCLLNQNLELIMISDNLNELIDSSKLLIKNSINSEFYILKSIKKVTCSIDIQDL